ncbi:DUF488 family protein [Halomarina rubra]|uniref:DUF488 family protein n=1 Tax=Halomarina rubra TaxID=2071873 RepID=A0ABD6AY65_9EURY|nr:DUF488 family protein [Halomarina rubra]
MSLDEPLGDTYVAAIQHGLVDIPENATLVGVVRHPTGWFHAAVDENYQALGLSADLLETFKQRHEDLKLHGMCDEGAHNAAWDELDVSGRYRSQLTNNPTAQQAVEDLLDRLRTGEHLVLVCFENTDKKRCHRTLLKSHIKAQLGDD